MCNGFRNKVYDPRVNKHVALIPCSHRRIKRIKVNDDGAINELELYLAANEQ
jgi:hypothetical protein